MFGLVFGEAQVFKNVTGRPRNLELHGSPRITLTCDPAAAPGAPAASLQPSPDRASGSGDSVSQTRAARRRLPRVWQHRPLGIQRPSECVSPALPVQWLAWASSRSARVPAALFAVGSLTADGRPLRRLGYPAGSAPAPR